MTRTTGAKFGWILFAFFLSFGALAGDGAHPEVTIGWEGSSAGFAIRVALPFMSGMREETVRQLGLLLPRPASLDAALDDAAAQRGGFLMKDARALPRASQTRISISSP